MNNIVTFIPRKQDEIKRRLMSKHFKVSNFNGNLRIIQYFKWLKLREEIFSCKLSLLTKHNNSGNLTGTIVPAYEN